MKEKVFTGVLRRGMFRLDEEACGTVEFELMDWEGKAVKITVEDLE